MSLFGSALTNTGSNVSITPYALNINFHSSHPKCWELKRQCKGSNMTRGPGSESSRTAYHKSLSRGHKNKLGMHNLPALATGYIKPIAHTYCVPKSHRGCSIHPSKLFSLLPQQQSHDYPDAPLKTRHAYSNRSVPGCSCTRGSNCLIIFYSAVPSSSIIVISSADCGSRSMLLQNGWPASKHA